MRDRKEEFMKAGPKGPPEADYVAQGGPIFSSNTIWTPTYAVDEKGLLLDSDPIADGVTSEVTRAGNAAYSDVSLYVTPEFPGGLFVEARTGDFSALEPGTVEVWDWWGTGQILLAWEGGPTTSQRWEVIGMCYDKAANKLWWVEATRDFGDRVNLDLRLWCWDVAAQGAAVMVHEEVNAAISDDVTEVYNGVVQNATHVAVVASKQQNLFDASRDSGYSIAIAKNGSGVQSGALGSYAGPMTNLTIRHDVPRTNTEKHENTVVAHHQRGTSTRRVRGEPNDSKVSEAMEAQLSGGAITESIVYGKPIEPTGGNVTQIIRSVPVSATQAMTVFITNEITFGLYTFVHTDAESFDEEQDPIDTHQTHTLLEP